MRILLLEDHSLEDHSSSLEDHSLEDHSSSSGNDASSITILLLADPHLQDHSSSSGDDPVLL